MAGSRAINKLTARGVQTLSKTGRHADGGNLYFKIRGASRAWVFFFRWQDRMVEMGLGTYPAISLAAARQLAAAARDHLAKGVDPLDARRRVEEDRKRAEVAAAGIPTFGAYTLALVDRIERGFSNPKHRQQWRNTLTTYCKPIWDTPVNDVDTVGVLACLTPIWGAKPETAQRVRGRIERVLNAAKAERLRSGENPATWRGHLDATLPKPSKLSRGHHAALPYADVPKFMADLRRREASAALALEFAILTATRTGEVIGARWVEFDLDAGLWTIPAIRMKARQEHRVPLSARVLEIVHKLASVRTSEYVFAGQRQGKPLSSMSMLMLLRRMERSDVTTHGFRSAFSDWASEVSSFSSELRETALAHTIANKAEAAYRRGDALERRRGMMEAWAQYCEPQTADRVDIRLDAAPPSGQIANQVTAPSDS
jgi:integrase